MLKQLFIPVVITVVSCNQGQKPGGHSDYTAKQKPQSSNEFSLEKSTQDPEIKKEKKIEIALAFINAYAENCNKLNKAVAMMEWVNSNKLSTKNFKSELKQLNDGANRKDPELGLGADPIVDAQDFPTEGFEAESFDEQTNYLTVKGKNWPDFKVTMKVAKEDNRWLVDGCGIINIPKDKRASR